MDRGAWRATVHRVTKSQISRLKRLSTHAVGKLQLKRWLRISLCKGYGAFVSAVCAGGVCWMCTLFLCLWWLNLQLWIYLCSLKFCSLQFCPSKVLLASVIPGGLSHWIFAQLSLKNILTLLKDKSFPKLIIMNLERYYVRGPSRTNGLGNLRSVIFRRVWVNRN